MAVDSPFATTVIEYEPGLNPASGYTQPVAALGSPQRMTSELFSPMVVTPFNPAYWPDEIVSIGEGGWLTLGFDHEVQNDPNNPFGVDLLVFGNAFRICVAFGGP